MKTIELLAPARHFDAGKAAVDNGADAVYIAGPQFGAREAAGNSVLAIEQLANYAHTYYAKVYLTLNTILYDNELEAARKLVYDAWNAGVDAVIVQDMALLEMDLPPIPLFASTQTNNATPEKVQFLQDVGFERVILARELSLAQIADIRKQTTVDLEFFVHGALCVSYSGQCYLSQSLTGRSANRGACAQPCRALYDLIDANNQPIVRNKHLLSLCDLNLSAQLPALLEAGITSFKIEGRLKNESYVKNVVAYYRQKIDALLAGTAMVKASSGKSMHLFTPDVERTFSRRFTDYFTTGRKADMALHDTGKAIGQKVGRIDKVGRNWVTYIGAVLHTADGICFFDTHGQLYGTNVNEVAGEKIGVQNSAGLTPGATVYRNFDFVFEQQLQAATRRVIAADITFVAGQHSICITATDEDKVSVSLQLPQCGEVAANEAAALKSIRSQLEKSGHSIFRFNVTEISCPTVFFYPLSTLNSWRRQLAELLLQQREKQRQRAVAVRTPNQVPYPEREADYRANCANRLSKIFYERHGVHVLAGAFEQSAPKEAQLMRTKYCIKHAVGACKKYGGTKALNEPVYLVNNGKRWLLTFDCANCQMIINQLRIEN